ncbi:MAG: FG-GAP-like repeat-containing protein [Lentimonas sp.]
MNFQDVSVAANILHTHSHAFDSGPESVVNFAPPVKEYMWMSGGAVAEDFDSDGWMDLYALQGGASANLLYMNQGDGTFIDEAAARGVANSGLHMGVTAADYDSDGDIDITYSSMTIGQNEFSQYTVVSAEVVLMINDGTGNFTSQSFTVPVGQKFLTSPSWGDLDADGDLDLVVGEWNVAASTTKLNIWHNFGGQLELVQSIPQLWSFHSKFADIDNDGDQDLLAVADFGNTKWYENNGYGIFTLNASMDVENGMGSAVGDVDNDGDLDWFISSIRDFDTAEANWGTTGNRLYLNGGYGVLSNSTDASGVRNGYWGWGSAFADFDNDGDLDLYHVNGWPDTAYNVPAQFNEKPALLFENLGAAVFQEIAGDVSTGDADNIGQGRCVVIFDYDNDGDEDIFIANNSSLDGTAGNYTFNPGLPVLLRNDTVNTNKWVDVLLSGSGSYHADGIGSRVYLDAGGITQMRELNASSGYNGHGPQRIAHYGLASTAIVDEVRVVWPNGDEVFAYDLAVDQAYTIESPSGSIDFREAELNTTVTATIAALDLPVGGSAEWIIDGVTYSMNQVATSFAVAGEYSFQLNIYDNGAPAALVRQEVFSVSISDGVADIDTVARKWNEQNLDAIRVDFPNPTVHARNLFHLSIGMWDAWSAYSSVAVGYLHNESTTAVDVGGARAETISYAAYRILSARYAVSVNGSTSLAFFKLQMLQLGYDPDDTSTLGSSPSALGNRIAETVLGYFSNDKWDDFTTFVGSDYTPTNTPMDVAGVGTVMADPNLWQPLLFEEAITQNGQTADVTQSFLGANWGGVRPFAISKAEGENLYYDPGMPPQLGGAEDQEFKDGNVEVILKSSLLDPDDSLMIDISPSSIGNNTLGYNDGTGHLLNPATGSPYPLNVVNHGDFGRVLAEFWADGPHSETPPGHWNALANEIVDHPDFLRKMGGQGVELDKLEWEVKMYFAMNGALHDAAVAAWGCKRVYDYARPISSIRYMAGLGQSTDISGPSYHVNGLPLVAGLVEVITARTSAVGQRHEHLSGFVGDIAIRAWTSSDTIDPETEHAGVDWILAESWLPYQRDTFVTPAFAGYISGHSTFSRAAAEVLTEMTGSPFFPGGIGQFTAYQNDYLEFENGPTTDIVLQWATYYDAADQAGLSRLYGGIHVPIDDGPGRIVGSKCGLASWELASKYYDGSILNEPISIEAKIIGPDSLELRWNAIRGFYHKLQGSPSVDGFVDLEQWSRSEDDVEVRMVVPSDEPTGSYFFRAERSPFDIVE